MSPSRPPNPARARALTTAFAITTVTACALGGLTPAVAAPAASVEPLSQLAAATTTSGVVKAAAATREISNDTAGKTLALTDGELRMVVAYDRRAVVTSFTQGGTELLAGGMSSSVVLDASGTTLDSGALTADPRVKVSGTNVDLTFTMASDEVRIDETWSFKLANDGIELRVARDYDWADGATQVIRHNGQLDIAWARVWDNIRRPADGGNIPIGNAYTGHDGFFLTETNDRYGVEQGAFVLLAAEGERALAVDAES